MTNICCEFVEYSDEVTKKPVSDCAKGESGKKNHHRVDGNLNEASKDFSGKMANLGKKAKA